ncbi:MAG: response regulator [Actinomycetota bacterium]
MITTEPLFLQSPVATSILDLSGHQVARNAAYRSLMSPDGTQAASRHDAPLPSAVDKAMSVAGEVPSVVQDHTIATGARPLRARTTTVVVTDDDGGRWLLQTTVPLGPLMSEEAMTSVCERVRGALATTDQLGRALGPTEHQHLVDDLLAMLNATRRTLEDSCPGDEEPTGAERGPNVLVVEDSRVNQLLFASQLTQLGYEHHLAEDGATGVAMATAEPFDAVLLDWHLPDIDGLEVAQRIRDHERQTGDHVPIIAVTARAMVGDREACLDAGMDDFLNKPVSIDELSDALLHWTRDGRTESDPPSASGVDEGVLRELTAQLGDETVVASVIETYLVELPGRTEALDQAVTAGDADQVRRIAHTLKSTSAMLGATALAGHCQRTESAAADPDAHLGELVAELQSLASGAEQDLEAALHELRSTTA